jgi:hypothetical protein
MDVSLKKTSAADWRGSRGARIVTGQPLGSSGGAPLDRVVAANTWNAARAIKHEQLGHLSVDAVADLAVLRVEKGSFGFTDMHGARLKGTSGCGAS